MPAFSIPPAGGRCKANRGHTPTTGGAGKGGVRKALTLRGPDRRVSVSDGGGGVRIRVKICGITRPEWACAAAEAGADAIGLIFAESPRQILPETAAEIIAALPPWVAPVGVFVDAPAAEVRGLAERLHLAAVQLHGDEPPQMLADLGPVKILKVFGVASEADLEAARRWRDRAEALGRTPDAYLVDARVPGGPRGGTGRAADWALVARMQQEGFRSLILAGGLGPENVVEAVRAVRPWGVDTSSGTEASPGEKSPEKIRAFVEAVRRMEHASEGAANG
ncbi:MAG: phosphoribosylanthranilate isomerase [Planctomycetes bacterium]|nr:phosphoribosylanthranilate isomerase [Planctomycetota bacterium]